MVCNHVSSTILTTYLILWIQTLTFNPFSFYISLKQNTESVADTNQEVTAAKASRSSSSGGTYQTPVCVSGNNGFNRAATRVATTIQVPGPNKEFIRNGLPKNRRRGNYKTCILLMISVKWKSMSMRWLNWNK